MRRREFITLLSGAAVAWPLAVHAQQRSMPMIGFLATGSSEMFRRPAAGFRQGLADAGYTEGRNVTIEFGWQNDQPPGRLWKLADDLVRRRAAVIVAAGGVSAAIAAKTATSTIPIVVAGGADPVRYGLATSLSRPGGNVTGMAFGQNELGGKQLALLLELVPQAKTVAYLVGNPEFETEQMSDMIAAAHSLGRQLTVLESRSPDDLEAAFATLVESGAGALVVRSFPVAFNNRRKILAAAAYHKIPAIYAAPQFAYEGGLMSYSPVGTFQQVALDYVAPILKGVKPADLPIQRPTRFQLVINLKTAKALGLEVPAKLLALADEVIE
jgi:putative ABC transport system substrate-binding protein